jgi:hypothetical protein
VTTASATWRSRSRFDLCALVGALLLACACGDDAERERDVVTRVVGEGVELSLEREVVEMLMARDGLDQQQAEAKAVRTLRLVAARRAELAARDKPPTYPDELDPVRREQLERAALVRLWLDETFEPANEAEDIPQRVIEQNLADPSLSRRLFHPELYFVCQALLVPAAKSEDGRNLEPPSEGEAAQQWRTAAEQAFAPFVDRVTGIAPDLLATDDCSLLGRLVGGSERSFAISELPGETEPAFTLRFEQFAFAPSVADTFDPGWVAAVTAPPASGTAERRIVGPFATRFGLHLVVIGKIEPARLAPGSLPPAELQAARELALRSEIEESWRADQLQRTLAELRDRRVVRLSPDLERGP